ncbi:MAG TPA: MFS transporter, partial [Candidatus Methylomirabilis sp.]|nr:MFS transporter [Candidatus Methylomirabilis sp.]
MRSNSSPPTARASRFLEWRARLPFPLPPLLLLVTIFALNFAARVILSPLLPIVELELGLRHGEAGFLFLLVQIGYCTGLLASGFVSYRWSYRRTILLSTTGVGLALLAISMSPSIGIIRAELVLLGMVAGLYLPAGIATITKMVPQEHWGKALAIHEMAPNLGYITAPLLAEALLRLVSWRGILAVLGTLAVLMGGCFQLFGREGAHTPESPRFKTMQQLIFDPAVWIAAMLFGVGIGTVLGFYTMMPLFLVSEVRMTRGLANTITGLSRLSGMIVIFASGVITDRIGHRRALMCVFGAT